MLIYLRDIDSTTLEPGKSEELYSSEVISNIFEGLVQFKKGTYDMQPCLATKWEVKDEGKKWIFFLRKGVTFHNGKEFDAQAVIATFKRRMSKKETELKRWWFFFPYMKNVKAIDKFTIEITLKKPYAPLLSAMADPTALIVAPESYQKKGFKPIGTGPFKFERWEKGEFLIISKNENYWDGSVPLSGVIFRVVENPASKTLHIKSGNADISRINTAMEYEEFLGKKEIKILTASSPHVCYLAFNTRKYPFSRIEVRKAMAHLINKKGLVKYIFQKMAVPAVTPIPPGLFGVNKNIKDYEYSISKAKNLLKKAGLENGFSCKLFFSRVNVGLQKIANVIVKNAKLVNITIKKVPLTFKELIRRGDKGEHDLGIFGWVGAPDPDFFFYPLFTMTKGNKNRAFYQNQNLRVLLEKARGTLSQVKRNEYYQLVQEIIHRDIPWVPLFHQKALVAYRYNIKHLYVNPNDYMIFKYVKKE